MKREGWAMKHLSGRLPIVLSLLLVVLVAVTVIAVPGPQEAKAAEDALITLTSGSSMYIDSNKPTQEGPQCSWMSFDIANTSSAPYETLTNVVVTFTITSGGTLFAQPVDNVREFASLAYPDTVPVFFYIDYFNALASGPGATATYQVTVTADGTLLDTLTGTITTVSSISANAGGSNVTTALGPGIYVGQILTTTMTYTFGNNQDISFQPSGATGFNETAYRLVGNTITSITTKKPNNYSGIAVGEGDQLRWSLADIPESGTGFTMVYYWEVLRVGQNAWVNPWAEGLSGNDYKYTGTDVVAEIPISQGGQIEVTKSVEPQFLATASSPGYDDTPGLVKYTVEFYNNLPLYDNSVPARPNPSIALSSIIDGLPPGVTIVDARYTDSDPLTDDTSLQILDYSASYPAYGDPLAPPPTTVTWTGAGAHYLDRHYAIAPQETLTLVYTADASSCPDGWYVNDVYGKVGSEATEHADAIFQIGGNPTLAVVSDFRAYDAGGSSVVVAWETVSEAGTAGYYVERLNASSDKWTRVNHRLVPVFFGSSDGGAYAIVDWAARPGDDLTYRLIEVEMSGGELVYGPYDVTAVDPLPSGEIYRSILQGYGNLRRAKLPYTIGPGTSATDTKGPAKKDGATLLRIETNEAGLYAVEATDIATGLGLTMKEAERLIRTAGLALSTHGQSVAYLRADDDTALYFYGEALDSIYASNNVYWLQVGKGDVVVKARGTGVSNRSTGAEPVTSFIDSIHAEENLQSGESLFSDPQSDIWIWWPLYAGYGSFDTKVFTLDAPDAISGVELDVALQGVTSTSHCAEIRLNGTVLGRIEWAGPVAKRGTLSIPAGLLQAGENQVEVVAILGAGVPYSYIAVESFDLTFERATKAVADQLLLGLGSASAVQIDGLSTTSAYVLDVADATDPEAVALTDSGVDSEGSWITFQASGGREYVVATAEGCLEPAALTSVAAGSLRDAANNADYLVITSESLLESADGFTAYRAGQGLATLTVTTSQIYDQFSYGIVDPNAIKDFLEYASAEWETGPRYVLLLGEGSFDYKDYTGSHDCIVPPLMVDSGYGLTPSDVLYGDVKNGDGVPDIAIGRMSVSSAAEAAAALTKVKTYESSIGSWRQSALFVADNADIGGDFAAESDALAALLPSGMQMAKAYLGQVSLGTARSAIAGAINNGSLLVSYVGHGSPRTLAGEGILTSDDVAGLGASKGLPILTAFTCRLGQYGMPGYDSLAERLAGDPDSGAIAVWASSADQESEDSTGLGQWFMKKFFETPGTVVLGDAIVAAQASASGKGVPEETIQTYNLLGDPALRVQW